MLQVVQLFELFVINSYPQHLFTPEGTAPCCLHHSLSLSSTASGSITISTDEIKSSSKHVDLKLDTKSCSNEVYYHTTLPLSHPPTITSSHYHTSHHHTITPSHYHTLPQSHPHTITLSHYHTLTLSHYDTLPLSHPPTITPSHHHTLPLSHPPTITANGPIPNNA